MAKHPTCPFCRQRTAPPTKEDIFAKWIAHLWPSKGHFEIIRYSHDETKPDRKWGAKGNVGFVMTKPCKTCNSGWMSDLEQQAQPALTKMIQGGDVDLTFADQKILAQWTVKTAIMFEFYQGRSERYFKPRDRHGLYKDKTLPRMLLFVARVADRERMGNTGWFNEYPFRLTMKTDDGSLDAEAYVSTFAIGQLALQIFTHRYEVTTLQFHVPGDWKSASVQIWPNALGKAVHWPPPLVLDADSLKVFAERWRSLKPNP